MITIPFNRPALAGREFEYMQRAMANKHISGDGEFSRRCHTLLEQLLPGSRALLTTSCTHALEMMALLLDIQPGDEVIVPDFTFVSTINAFALRGARPVFCDIRPDTLNLDEARLEQLISSRTRAIVAVHYAGVGCAMEAILALAERHGVPVLEDNAHGLFGRYRGQALGTFGALAAQSFHETKNISCGEGGALLINDPRLTERAEIIREKGTNRSRFFRGQVDKYTWVDLGSSYLPSDLLAAYLYAQLEARDQIQARRQRVWETYAAELSEWAQRSGVRLPCVPAECEQPFHMFYLLLPDLEQRQRFIQHLDQNGIQAVFHYLPLHRSEYGQRAGGAAADCPVSARVSDQLVRLPFYNELSEADQSRVIEAVRCFRPDHALTN